MKDQSAVNLGDIKKLHSQYVILDDGVVQSDFICGREHEGHEGLLHGGVISYVLDAAMGNCMFANKKITVTAEMKVKFVKPVKIDTLTRVRSWINRAVGVLNLVEAEVIQDGLVVAKAEAKFLEQPQMLTEKLASKHNIRESVVEK